jgi:protein-S-isoprenylcysteine O-methyltransferase Ste14
MQDEKMSIMGIDIKFVSISMIYLLIVILVNYFTRPLFYIIGLPIQAAITLAVILLIIGIPYYIQSAKTIYKIHNEGKLCTTGIYATCRHPLYSSWIFFNCPVIAILFRSWILLTVPVFMYFLLIILIGEEERYLIKRYGNEYLDYKKNTNLAFPKLWKLINKK